jgi:hypothetical protein
MFPSPNRSYRVYIRNEYRRPIPHQTKTKDMIKRRCFLTFEAAFEFAQTLRVDFKLDHAYGSLDGLLYQVEYNDVNYGRADIRVGIVGRICDIPDNQIQKYREANYRLRAELRKVTADNDAHRKYAGELIVKNIGLRNTITKIGTEIIMRNEYGQRRSATINNIFKIITQN